MVPVAAGWFDAAELRVVEADRGTGSVGRAPLGQQAPVADWLTQVEVHRLGHAGWSWAVCSD